MSRTSKRKSAYTAKRTIQPDVIANTASVPEKSLKSNVSGYNALEYIKRDVLWSLACTVVIVVLMIVAYNVLV